MSICPFMSKPEGLNPGMDNLYPCIQSCELFTGKECSLKLLARANFKIAKTLSSKDDEKSN